MKRFSKYQTRKAQRFAREARGTDWLAYKGHIIARTASGSVAIIAGGRLIDHAPSEQEAKAKIDLTRATANLRSD